VKGGQSTRTILPEPRAPGERARCRRRAVLHFVETGRARAVRDDDEPLERDPCGAPRAWRKGQVSSSCSAELRPATFTLSRRPVGGRDDEALQRNPAPAPDPVKVGSGPRGVRSSVSYTTTGPACGAGCVGMRCFETVHAPRDVVRSEESRSDESVTGAPTLFASSITVTVTAARSSVAALASVVTLLLVRRLVRQFVRILGLLLRCSCRARRSTVLASGWVAPLGALSLSHSLLFSQFPPSFPHSFPSPPSFHPHFISYS
jgi:hypothetical protein